MVPAARDQPFPPAVHQDRVPWHCIPPPGAGEGENVGETGRMMLVPGLYIYININNRALS